MSTRKRAHEFAQRGHVLIRDALHPSEIDRLRTELARAITRARVTDGLRISRGQVYAARNLGRIYPRLRPFARCIPRRLELAQLCGHDHRLVRAMFFDKPPGCSWSLPWHRDHNVAVRTSELSSRVRRRAGIDHVVASDERLQSMVTLRIHLDPAGATNGGLWIASGSHRHSRQRPRSEGELIEASAGDVLVMRPRVLHRSLASRSADGHRRIVHLEYASEGPPAPGHEWADVWPATT